MTVTRGTVNIDGDQRSPYDTLTVVGDSTTNVSNVHGAEDITATQNATVNITNSTGVAVHTGISFGGMPSFGTVHINTTGNNQVDINTPWRGLFGPVAIHNTGVLTGSLHPFGMDYTLEGGQFSNTDSYGGFDGNHMIVNADVIGKGLFHVGSFHAPGGLGKLEFMKSVGPDQTVRMESGIGYSTLQVDHPDQFKAAIDWETYDGVIDLNGLAADSYSYHDGVLDFFSGSTLTDTLRFNNPNSASNQFLVAQGASTGGAGVEIFSTGPVPAQSIPHGQILFAHA